MNARDNTSPESVMTLDDPRWAAVVARDAQADGKFYYAVKTTGVYCRPSCAARLARPENVSFFLDCHAAEAAGYRPCRRCKPNAISLARQHADLVTHACRMLEQSDVTPTLEQLAHQAGMSPYYFHRLFKQLVGLTPRQYAQARRTRRLHHELAHGPSVTQAIYNAGYQSSSRFYEKADAMLGMRASTYRAGGAAMPIRFAVGECTLGAILVAQSERGICAISIGDNPEVLLHELQDRFSHADLIGGDQAFEQVVAQVVGLINRPGTNLDLPLDIRGTVFQQRVWDALRAIPAGETLTYTDVAARIGMPNAVRAVASACAANALAVAIPCHRVVRTDGSLSGYRWGIARKQTLLEMEAKLCPKGK